MTSSKEAWKTVDAVVSSVERIDGTPTSFGHFLVEYAYSVGPVQHSGSFRTYVSESLDPLHAHDVFTIRYDPQKPSNSFYPGAVGPWALRWMALAAGLVALVVLGILAMAVNYLLKFV